MKQPKHSPPEWPVVPPWYKENLGHSRSQVVRKCKSCKDSSFEALYHGKLTGKCCRCGKEY